MTRRTPTSPPVIETRTAPLVVRIEPIGPKGLRVRIELDTGDPLEVTLEAVEATSLGVGDPLAPPEQHHLLSLDADVRVREAALALLAHRARTRRELRRRLRQKGFPAARVDPCLDRLAERGLLDDRAVATAFVRDRLRHRPRGKARLVSELRAKGVDADVAEEAIDQVFGDEQTSDPGLAREAAKAWLARQGASVRAALTSESATPERNKARRRLYGYLARRGFRGDALDVAAQEARSSAGDEGD